MIVLILIVIMFIALDITALWWGCDSRDGIDSAEWLRRQQWSLTRFVRQD